MPGATVGGMTEDRFLTYEQMADLSRELEAGGFTHVVATHLINPEWRRQYRANRPEMDNVAWTVRLNEYLVPMDKIKALIEICDRHGFVFWMGSRDYDDVDGTGGTEFYFKVGTPTSNVIPSGWS